MARIDYYKFGFYDPYRCGGEYYATIKARTMSYCYDAHSYAIGLIDCKSR